jgi:hypothetical protein
MQVLKFVYALIEKTNKKGKLAFTKTRETQMNAKTSFKVSLGIMPDYTYNGPGVRADGVTDGRAAQKQGLRLEILLCKLENTNLQTYRLIWEP